MKQPSKLEVELVEIDKIIPHEANERLHPERNIEMLRKGLDDFDQQKPIVVDDKYKIIAGHGVWYAAKKAGFSHRYVCKSKLKGNKKRAYRIFDNSSGESSKWDDEKLSKSLKELYDDGYAVADLGFDPSDYELEKPDYDDEKDDNIPDVKENKFGVERGQIWQLGEHRLMCGDSTNEDGVSELMNNEKADMVFTDPPYELKEKDLKESLLCNINDIVTLCTFKQALILSKHFNFHFDFVFIANLPKSFMNQKQPYYLHQTGCYFTLDGNTSFNCANAKGVRSDKKYWSTVIDAPRDITKHGHGKSVKGIIECLSGWNKKGVYDPFLGSGSTLIACEKTNRKCFGMEIDPHYCSVIMQRWQEFSGKEAKLISQQTQS